jgi:hypothetical protein
MATRGSEAAKHEARKRACYTSFALSDLDVSGGLPFLLRQFSPAQISPKPLQRNHLRLEQCAFSSLLSVVPPDNESNGGIK